MSESKLSVVEVVKESDNFVQMLGFSNEHEIAVLPKEQLREMVHKIEDYVNTYGEKIEVPVKHYFSKGVYAREMPMKKGEIVIGKIHKYENFNVLSKGKVSVLSIDGIKIVEAPYSFVGSPGTKRVIYAHEDSVWTVVHGTDEKDIEKIEVEFIAKDYSELESLEFKEKLCLG